MIMNELFSMDSSLSLNYWHDYKLFVVWIGDLSRVRWETVEAVILVVGV